MRTQERIEGMIEGGSQKKGDIKMEDESFGEESKINTVKKVNQGSVVTNQYQTPTKEKIINDISIHFKGKTESTLNLCNKFNSILNIELLK